MGLRAKKSSSPSLNIGPTDFLPSVSARASISINATYGEFGLLSDCHRPPGNGPALAPALVDGFNTIQRLGLVCVETHLESL